MPWPATVGLNQLCIGTISPGTNATSNFALSVLQAGGTATVAAATGQTVLGIIGIQQASSGATAPTVTIAIPGIDFQSSIVTAGSLKQLATTDFRSYSLFVFLTPAAP